MAERGHSRRIMDDAPIAGSQKVVQCSKKTFRNHKAGAEGLRVDEPISKIKGAWEVPFTG